MPGHAPIIIDAGTGLRHLGKELVTRFPDKTTAHLLISHTHWDHIQGLPYFSPLYGSGNELQIYARQAGDGDTHLRSVFAHQNDGPYFPVPMDSLKARVDFHELLEGQTFNIGDVKVTCTRLNHPWIAMAYRLDHDGYSVVYCSDTAPFRDILLEHEFVSTPPKPGEPLDKEVERKLHSMREKLVELCKGADFLIYDTQFTPEEYAAKPHWGHSTPDDAIAIAREAKAKHLCLFHHSPTRSDDEQDAILSHYATLLGGEPLKLSAAMEGMMVEIGDNP